MSVGLITLALSLLLALSHSAQRPAGHNNVDARDVLARTGGAPKRFCQRQELVPKDTRAIKASLSSRARPGPAVAVTASKGGAVLTAGRRPAGWSGTSVSVPVRPVDRAVADVRVCLSVGRGPTTTLLGSTTTAPPGSNTDLPDQVDDRPRGRRFRIDYLRGGTESWWSYASTIAHRMGLNHALGGPWSALLAALAMFAAAGIVAARLVRDLGTAPARVLGRLPTAAWACALVGCLNALTWSIISPPFQAFDEQDHFAYIQGLAETGRAPNSQTFLYSQEETAALRRVRFLTVRLNGSNVPNWSSLERQRLDRALSADLERAGTGSAGFATFQPPLYYLLETIPYRVGSPGSLLQRLMLMRMLSALLAGFCALAVFLFLREALPRTPWAWTVGGLAAALQPMFGFASSAVNSDALLFAVSAALFYCLARAFRRGLTVRLSVATGLVLAAGVLAKVTFAGLLVGAIVGLLAIAVRQAPQARLSTLRLPVIAGASALASLIVFGILNAAWDRPVLGVAAAVPGTIDQTAGAPTGSLSEELLFIWQFYLPPLPGMTHYFGSPLTFRDIWFNGFVGAFGWFTIQPPRWVQDIALVPAIGALILCAIGLVRARRDVRRRLLEVAVYGLMVGGALAIVGVAQYGSSLAQAHWFGQSRYLLPLLAPFALVLAIAARGAGRRWGPVAGILIVMVVLGHDIHSQLLAISGFYG